MQTQHTFSTQSVVYYNFYSFPDKILRDKDNKILKQRRKCIKKSPKKYLPEKICQGSFPSC